MSSNGSRTAGGVTDFARGFVRAFLLSVVILSVGAASALAESKILGQVLSKDSGDPLPFANIILTRVDGTAESPAGGTFTMEDGSYRLDAAPGTYKLLISFIGYNPLTVTDISVTDGQPTTLNLTLAPSVVDSDIEEQVVEAKRVENSETFILRQQKKAAAVSDGISLAQMKKTSDSNAAEALQRVTGLSVVDGQNVFVRGLGERYSSTTINGATVGSPEPNKRVLPMDMFATGLLDNIVVQKTYTPDKPGDFGGGVVDVATRDFPGTRVWSLSVGSGGNSNTTGKDFASYEGGDWDFLGFDDGTRDLPDEIPDDKVAQCGRFCGPDFPGYPADQIEVFGESFDQVWESKNGNGSLPRSLSASYGNEVFFLDQPLGFLGSFSYSRSFKTIDKEENTFLNETLGAKTLYDLRKSTASTLWGAIGTLNYRLNDYNNIYFRTMYNRSADDEHRTYEGSNFDFGADVLNNRLQYVERGIFTSSVRGKSIITPFRNSTLEWKVGYSEATRDEPDRRDYVYERDEDNADAPWTLSQRGNAFERFFGEQSEDAWDYEANMTIPLGSSLSRETKLKVGGLYSDKTRTFRFRRFAYQNPSGTGIDLTQDPEDLLTDENIGTKISQFRLIEFTKGTDNYDASHEITAGFAMLDVPVGEKLKLVGGARVETSKQRVDTFDLFDSDAEPLVGEIDKTDVLPALNATYQLTENMNLRAAYARTLNRPDLRELSPFSYNSYGASSFEEAGNDSLDRALIDNFDLRWENYVGSEFYAVSVFYKDMTNPIESSLQGGQQPIFVPINADDAFLYGAELEARVELSRLATAGEDGSGLMHFLKSRVQETTLNANLTLIESESNLGEEAGISTSEKRPLTGQSPYVVNLGLFWASEARTTNASVLYTVFGRRLRNIGPGSTPDIYEQPRHSLDLSVGRQFGGVNAKFAVENVLDDEHEFEQEGADRTEITERWKDGRSFSLSLSIGS